jgi:hypothetical protein
MWWPESVAAAGLQWLAVSGCLAVAPGGPGYEGPGSTYRVIYRTDETSGIDHVLDIDYRPEFYRHRQR